MFKSTLFTLLLFFLYFSSDAQCWNLVWEDDFNGSSLDLTKWTPQIGAGGWGNNELQYYTGRPNNVTISNGNLQIIAQEENYMGSNYTSARLRSIYQGDWRYGRFEARIKTPIGQGLWPAFWMLSTDSPYGAWPQTGEMDIMEIVGHQPATSYASFHYGTAGNLQTQSTGYTLSSSDFSTAFHLFAMEWDPTELRFYIDGNLYFTGTQASVAPYNWPFDQKFHFLLNVAVGGNWPGSPDASTVFPQIMEVDYVRVYQQLSDITIDGEDLVLPNTAGSVYRVPNMPNASYIWSVPAGATITSGQNTNEIQVNWGNTSGSVLCEITTSCGVNTSVLDVTVSINMLSNYGFEQDYSNWRTRLDNGANANFNILTSNVQEGLKSACVEVLNTGNNNWDIQLIHGGLNYVNGTDYTLTFWAKSDISGRQITTAFIDPVTFVLYNVKNYVLTNSWALYTYNFTASTSGEVQMNMDIGQSTGTVCLDNFVFTKSALLPIDLIDFSGKIIDHNRVELSWRSGALQNVEELQIQRRKEDVWETIGVVSSKLYRFVDNHPVDGENYYRLKEIDVNGSERYSKIVSVAIKTSGIHVYPNPATDVLMIQGQSESFSSFILYNQLGQKIKKGEVLNQQIDISDVPAGIYLLELKSGTQTEVLRGIKY